MVKVGMGITLDIEVKEALSKYVNSSEVINAILKRELLSVDGIDTEIKKLEFEIRHLKEKKESIEKNYKDRVKNMPRGLKQEMSKIAGILKIHPDKAGIWSQVIIKRYGFIINGNELLKLAKGWKK